MAITSGTYVRTYFSGQYKPKKIIHVYSGLNGNTYRVSFARKENPSNTDIITDGDISHVFLNGKWEKYAEGGR